MKVSVIICAAGRGERAALGKNKVLAPLYGAPVLWHTLKAFAFAHQIIVTANENDLQEISALCAPFHAAVCLGGATRTQSVYNALALVTGDIVLIHDGARPYVTHNIVQGCIDSANRFGSGICAVACTDTIAVCKDGAIQNVPDRNALYHVQTPQGFVTADIKKAYRQAITDGNSYTDDSAVYARYIGSPHLCAGDIQNKKLTYPSDFTQGERALLQGERIGFGVDVHAFGAGEGVTLCGVFIPHTHGLIAHSDGDVAAHAVMDALLSAAGLKDIGHYFPDTDPQWKNACSMDMLKQVVTLIIEAGFAVSNLSLSVQAEKPKLAPYIDAMKENLANALQIYTQNIAVSAGTCEGLGFVGERLGVAAYAAACVQTNKR